jgi:hypothetical protein
MKSAVIAKPNLKLFVCGAMLVAVIGHFAGAGRSENSMVVQARMSDEVLRQMIEQAALNATPEIFTQISAVYEQRGEHRRALLFLRLAARLEDSEANPHTN